MCLASILKADYVDPLGEAEGAPEFATQAERETYIVKLESDTHEATKKIEFEKATMLRDTLEDLLSKEFLFN